MSAELLDESHETAEGRFAAHEAPWKTTHRHALVENAVDRPTSTGDEVRYIIAGDQRLKVQGNEDGTVSLLNPDNSVARNLPKGWF